MDWNVIRPALESLIETITSVPVSNVEWRDKRQAVTVPTWSVNGGPTESGVQVMLEVEAVEDVGQAETRSLYDEDTDTLSLITVTQHRFTLLVEVESLSQEDRGIAERFLNEIGTRIRHPSSLDALRAVNISLSTVRPTVDAFYQVDERTYSKASRQIVFNASHSEADRLYDGSHIEATEIEGTIKGGNELYVDEAEVDGLIGVI